MRTNEVKKNAPEALDAHKKATDYAPLPTGSLPDAWNWAGGDGDVNLGPSRNQHIPQYCGSCWANATASMLEDRMIIAQHRAQATPGGGFVNPRVSVQDIIGITTKEHGCYGGDSLVALKAIKEHGVVSDTCNQYVACSESFPEGHTVSGFCADYLNQHHPEQHSEQRCITCSGFPGDSDASDGSCSNSMDVPGACCNPVKKPYTYNINETHLIADKCETSVMAEIKKYYEKKCTDLIVKSALACPASRKCMKDGEDPSFTGWNASTKKSVSDTQCMIDACPDVAKDAKICQGWWDDPNGWLGDDYKTKMNECQTAAGYGLGVKQRVQQMKAAIHSGGPSACNVAADKLDTYTGGVIDAPSASRLTDHVVEVVGWGQGGDGSDHWVVRNSWGEYWGDRGFFKVKAGENQLGIESYCSFADVQVPRTPAPTFCSLDGLSCT